MVAKYDKVKWEAFRQQVQESLLQIQEQLTRIEKLLVVPVKKTSGKAKRDKQT